MARLLSIGLQGDDVKNLQLQLNRLPSRLAPLTVDGIFGPRTRERVVEFQNDKGLQPDGIAGPATLAAIDRAIPKVDLREYDAIMALAISTLRSQRGNTSRGVQYFLRQKPMLDSIARAGHVVPVRSFIQIGNKLVAAPSVNPQFGAVGAVVLVAVILVILAFAAAMAVIMGQNANQSAQELARLEREFEIRMIELNRILSEAPIKAIVLIAAMMSAVEAAIRAQLDNLKRMIERCRQLAGQAKMSECLPKFNKIDEQMRHIISQAILQGFEKESDRAKILIGLARSVGFLMLLISDWAKCMTCPFLQFF